MATPVVPITTVAGIVRGYTVTAIVRIATGIGNGVAGDGELTLAIEMRRSSLRRLDRPSRCLWTGFLVQGSSSVLESIPAGF